MTPREPMVLTCSQDTVRQAVQLRRDGLSIARISLQLGYHRRTTARYLRLYDRYGIEAFARRS